MSIKTNFSNMERENVIEISTRLIALDILEMHNLEMEIFIKSYDNNSFKATVDLSKYVDNVIYISRYSEIFLKGNRKLAYIKTIDTNFDRNTNVITLTCTISNEINLYIREKVFIAISLFTIKSDKQYATFVYSASQALFWGTPNEVAIRMRSSIDKFCEEYFDKMPSNKGNFIKDITNNSYFFKYDGYESFVDNLYAKFRKVRFKRNEDIHKCLQNIKLVEALDFFICILDILVLLYIYKTKYFIPTDTFDKAFYNYISLNRESIEI